MPKHTPNQLEFQCDNPGPNPSGFCMCGCGSAAPISKQTDTKRGYVKGKPLRFIAGHQHVIIPRHRRTLAERFWEKVDKSDGPQACWIWTGAKTLDGYGDIFTGLGRGRAHRVSWELHNGAIPDGLQVLHHCDNPSCVNPTHLWLGNHAENMADMSKKKRGKSNPACGENSTSSKLTNSDVMEIRKLRANGVTRRVLAEKYGVTEGTIGHIASRTTWKHLP